MLLWLKTNALTTLQQRSQNGNGTNNKTIDYDIYE